MTGTSMSVTQIVFWVWTGLVVVGTLIPFVREQTWWLRAWTYARLQMLVIAVLTSLAYLAIWGANGTAQMWIFAALMAFVIGSCLWDILPFTPLYPKMTRDHIPGEAHTPVSLLVGNVLMDNDQCEGLLSSINTVDPDLVFLVETNDDWRDKLSVLEDRYPHQYLLPLPDYNGMLFYSRFPIKHVQERYLVLDYIPSLTIDLEIDGRPVRFYGVHPRPPRPRDETRHLDQELSFIANEAGHSLTPVIVTGDLNDVGWSSTTRKFLRVSGLQDPRRGRGLFNSYNAVYPFVRWPLDHIFHSRDFTLIEIKRLPKFGSDHFPIYVKFALYPQES